MNKIFQVALLFLSILGNFTLIPQTKASINSNLAITVNGMKNQKGQVCFSVFSTRQGFPSDTRRAIKSQCVKVGDTAVNLNLNNLKAGNYAVAVFHDANGDGNLNTNFLGIPTEGFGFSNNPRIRTGPPNFVESAVFVVGSGTNVQIQLQHLL
jgi:uncharacterized protein (DUF2141 family)